MEFFCLRESVEMWTDFLELLLSKHEMLAMTIFMALIPDSFEEGMKLLVEFWSHGSELG